MDNPENATLVGKPDQLSIDIPPNLSNKEISPENIKRIINLNYRFYHIFNLIGVCFSLLDIYVLPSDMVSIYIIIANIVIPMWFMFNLCNKWYVPTNILISMVWVVTVDLTVLYGVMHSTPRLKSIVELVIVLMICVCLCITSCMGGKIYNKGPC